MSQAQGEFKGQILGHPLTNNAPLPLTLYVLHCITPNPGCVMFPLQTATQDMHKIPEIILSITWKGVKFMDAETKVIVCASSGICEI